MQPILEIDVQNKQQKHIGLAAASCTCNVTSPFYDGLEQLMMKASERPKWN